MNVKRYHFIETMIWVGIPFLFMIIDWFYIHVLNIEYLELFIVATIYRTYQK